MSRIVDTIKDGGRITPEEFLQLAADADVYKLAFLANSIRRRLHPDPIVTYVVDRNINYTDICISACKFCAFFKAPEDKTGSVLSFSELDAKIQETQELGGTQILLRNLIDTSLTWGDPLLRVSLVKPHER